jgi:diguanylate cyclase (GGDEF)-like protein
VERSIINTRASVIEITAALSFEELCNKIIENLKIFSIRGCYIINYDRVYEHRKNTGWKVPEKLKLFLAYNENADFNIDRGKDYRVSPDELIPGELYDDSGSHIFLAVPNYYLLDQYGYIIYDMSLRDGNVYDFISLAISSTFRSVLLLNERKTAEMKLREVLSELENTNKKLSSLSETDDLTGLFNRRGFIRVANQQLALVKQIQQNGVLFYIDLDSLKKINDRYGHDSGDTALKMTAGILKNVFRKMDIIGRIGGDEFVVLTINTDELTKGIISRRFSEVIKEENKYSGKDFTLALTLGESSFKWEDDITIFELMERADRVLYSRKEEKKKMTNDEVRMGK